MMRSGEVPAGISMRAKWTLTPTGTARGYHASTTLLTLGTMTPSRTSAAITRPSALAGTRLYRSVPRLWRRGEPCFRQPKKEKGRCAACAQAAPNSASSVEPDLFHAPTVVDAVDHDGQVLDLRVRADAAAIEVDQRPRAVLGQPPFDLPDQLVALVLVRFHRLLVNQLVHFGVAVAVVIADTAAGIVLVEQRIRIVDISAGQVQRDRVVLAHDPGIPLRRIERFELAVDIDLLQLVEQDHRRIAVGRDVARRHRDLQMAVGPVAELFHNLARLGAALGDIGSIAGQRIEHLLGHAPQ